MFGRLSYLFWGIVVLTESLRADAYCQQYNNVSMAPIAMNHACKPSYNSDCQNWVISVLIFTYRTVGSSGAYEVKEVLRESLQNCDSSMQIVIYEPGVSGIINRAQFPNEGQMWGDSTSTLFTDDYINLLGNFSEQTDQLVKLLNYTKHNMSDVSSSQNGQLYIFTDLSCHDLCDHNNTNPGSALYSFLEYASNKFYNIWIFNFDPVEYYAACGAVLTRANIFIDKMPNSTIIQQQYLVCPYQMTSTHLTSSPTPYGTGGLGKTTPSSTLKEPETTTKKPFKAPGLSDAELAMLIGIPFASLVVCCGICACVCVKCTSARAKAMSNFKKWKYGESGKMPQTIEECAMEIEIHKKMGKLPHMENFATANLYMDIKQLASKNKKDYWELPPKQLIIHETEILGSGAFANVFKGTLTGKIPLLKAQSGMSVALENRKDGSCEVAVKRLPPHADEQNKMDFFHEMQFMKRLGYHVHVISMLGCVSDPEDPLILVEYCQHGDLLHFLRSHRSALKGDTDKLLSVKNLVSIAWQISDGLSYLHANNFVHRDIAARNILLTNNLVAKVSDFGLCRYIDSALYTAKGGKLPIKWMAIESLKFYEYSPKSDVWAYGVCIWEVFSFGEGPFPAIQPLDMLKYIEDGNRLPQSETCPNEIYALLLETWKSSSADRPDINEMKAKLMAMLNLDDEHYGYLDCGSNDNGPPLYIEDIAIKQLKHDISQNIDTHNISTYDDKEVERF